MQIIEFWLLALLVGGLLLGGWSIAWARTKQLGPRASWGKILFVFTLLTSGASTVLAAVCCPQWLAPHGLSMGWLVVAMLWDGPARVWRASHMPVDEK